MGAYKNQETKRAKGVPWIGAGTKRRKEPFFNMMQRVAAWPPSWLDPKFPIRSRPLEERRPGREIRSSGCVVPDSRSEVSHTRSVGGKQKKARRLPEKPTGLGALVGSLSAGQKVSLTEIPTVRPLR